MFENPNTLIFMLITFLVVILVVPKLMVGIVKGHPKKRHRDYLALFEAIARELGLSHKLVSTGHFHSSPLVADRKQVYVPQKEPIIKGVRGGRAIEIHGHVEITRRGMKDYVHRTAVTVDLDGEFWKSGVRIEPRDRLTQFEKTVVGSLAKLDHSKDIPIGDHRFDNEFLLAGLIKEHTAEVLRTDAVQDELRAVRDNFMWFQIRLGRLTVELDDATQNKDEFMARLDEVFAAADSLDAVVDQGAAEELFPAMG